MNITVFFILTKYYQLLTNKDRDLLFVAFLSRIKYNTVNDMMN